MAFAAWIAAGALAAAGPARAQDDKAPNPADAALAEALFMEARDLMRQKDYAAACPKFAESYRLDPALGALINLASCHELEGKIATAWGEFQNLEAQALRAGDKARQKLAADRAKALEPRLPRIVLRMEDAPDGLEVARDGATLGAASLGTPLPIDPGEHEISATAPGRKRWSTRVVAKEGERLDVEIPALEIDPDAGRADAAPDRGAGAPAGPAPAAGLDGRAVAGVIVGSVGVAGLAAGGVFVALLVSRKGDADADCTDDGQGTKRCGTDGLNAVSAAEDWANAANIAFAAGGALVVAGGILLLTSGGGAPAEPAPAVSVLPAIGPGGGGLTARFRF